MCLGMRRIPTSDRDTHPVGHVSWHAGEIREDQDVVASCNGDEEQPTLLLHEPLLFGWCKAARYRAGDHPSDAAEDDHHVGRHCRRRSRYPRAYVL